MSFADLSGLPVIHGRVVTPFTGLWHADLELAIDDGQAQPTGLQTLNLGGSPWICTPIRSIDFAGRRGTRVVAGAGGWRLSIPAKQYGDAPSLVAAIVLDAAMACGELPPNTAGAQSYVPAYDRPAGVASLVLQQLFDRVWWANPSGIVQTTQRASVPIASEFFILEVSGPEGAYEIATEFPNDWVPNNTFAGPTGSGIISRVEHVIEPDKLRTIAMVKR